MARARMRGRGGYPGRRSSAVFRSTARENSDPPLSGLLPTAIPGANTLRLRLPRDSHQHAAQDIGRGGEHRVGAVRISASLGSNYGPPFEGRAQGGFQSSWALRGTCGQDQMPIPTKPKIPQHRSMRADRASRLLRTELRNSRSTTIGGTLMAKIDGAAGLPSMPPMRVPFV